MFTRPQHNGDEVEWDLNLTTTHSNATDPPVRYQLGRIQLEMLERDDRTFLKRLQECIVNHGHYLAGTIFKTTLFKIFHVERLNLIFLNGKVYYIQLKKERTSTAPCII